MKTNSIPQILNSFLNIGLLFFTLSDIELFLLSLLKLLLLNI